MSSMDAGFSGPGVVDQWHLNSINIVPLAAAFGENLQLTLLHQTPDLTASMKPKEEVVCNTVESESSYHEGNKRDRVGLLLPRAQDHIIAERKRRDKLSQRFIALSAIVPGLKKMDKASILGDAINYLKQLQERVKTLEEQTRNRTMESVVFVRKSQLNADDGKSFSYENASGGPLHQKLPEIEVRVSDRSLLLIVHCQRRKGVYEKIVAEIERLHLSVVSSNVMTFSASALNLTIISQMDAGFNISAKDLEKALRSSFM